MSRTASETYIIEKLTQINSEIAQTLNAQEGEIKEPLTVKDVPKIVSQIYRLGDRYMEFVGSEFQALFTHEGLTENEMLEETRRVVELYSAMIDVMMQLYVRILDITVQEPFEKAQHYSLRLINHLLGSVYDFNDQMIDAYTERLYGAKLGLSIDLNSELDRMNRWFDEVKAQNAYDSDIRFVGKFTQKRPQAHK